MYTWIRRQPRLGVPNPPTANTHCASLLTQPRARRDRALRRVPVCACICRAIMCQHDIDTDLDADVNSDINTDINTDVYTDGVACPTEDPEYSPD